MQSHSPMLSKIIAVEKALTSWQETSSSRHPEQANYYINEALTFIQGLKADTESSDSDIEIDIACVMAGSLIAALAYSQSYYPHDLSDISNNNPKRYYPITWVELIDDEFIKNHSSTDKKTERSNINFYLGQKILAAKLPFEVKNIEPLVSYKMHYHLEVIASRITPANNPLPFPNQNDMQIIQRHKLEVINAADDPELRNVSRIERAFKRASIACGTHLNSYEKQKFSDEIVNLKDQTLKAHLAEKAGFDLEGCLSLADSVKKLALKVRDNTLTQADCQEFEAVAYDYRSYDACTALIKSIALIATGLVVGVGIGLLAGSSVGALVGGLGLFVLAAAQRYYSVKKEIENDATLQLNILADRMLVRV
jgi:hypothetical protein